MTTLKNGTKGEIVSGLSMRGIIILVYIHISKQNSTICVLKSAAGIPSSFGVSLDMNIAMSL